MMNILPKQVIARRLRELQLSNRGKDGAADRVPIAQLAELIGVSRVTIYAAARGQMSETTQIRLCRVLPRIEWGLLAFKRVDGKWQVVQSVAPRKPVKTRMAVVIMPNGPKLTFAPQSSQPLVMPSIAELVLGRKSS